MRDTCSVAKLAMVVFHVVVKLDFISWLTLTMTTAFPYVFSSGEWFDGEISQIEKIHLSYDLGYLIPKPVYFRSSIWTKLMLSLPDSNFGFLARKTCHKQPQNQLTWRTVFSRYAVRVSLQENSTWNPTQLAT